MGGGKLINHPNSEPGEDCRPFWRAKLSQQVGRAEAD